MPNEKVRHLADALIGSPGSTELQDQIESLSLDECRQLDTLCFCCAGCDWWCAESERNECDDMWYCDDCAE